MATRTYSNGNRQFAITQVGTAGSYSSWTVENIRDATTGDVVLPVPGLQNVVASDEDAALARACDRIDGWLKLKQ